MHPIPGTTRTPLLADAFPLPRSRPFTLAEAAERGVSRDALRRLVHEVLLRRMLPGVYVAAELADSLELRAKAISLVVPRTCIITDRPAAWLLGVDVLAPGDHLRIPELCVFQQPGGTRVRRQGCIGGERTLADEDIMEVDGVRVTTPLRTALDLGRLLRRDHAIGALDGLLRLGTFSKAQLLSEVERFRGMRGVVQLRELAPQVDARAESPAESVMRLRWLDAGDLPRPTPQISICDRWGREIYRLDLGLPEVKYAAEYDGVAFHEGEDAEQHDTERRRWLRDNQGWTIDVLKRPQVFGPRECAAEIYRAGIFAARAKLGAFRPTPPTSITPRVTGQQGWIHRE